MKRPDDIDAFEQLLGEALDPGEVALSEEQRAEIRHAAEFAALLARELDPGEIDMGENRRNALVGRLRDRAREEDLTAWALGELAEERWEAIEERMRCREEWRVEALAIRRFCDRAQSLLPALAAPGWWQRRRLRRIFAGPLRRERALWPAVAAVAVLLLVRFEMGEHAVSGNAAPVAVVAPQAKPPLAVAAGVVEALSVAALPEGPPDRERRAEGIAFAAPRLGPPEPAFAFTAVPERPSPARPIAAAPDLDRLLAAVLELPSDGGLLAGVGRGQAGGSAWPSRGGRDRLASLDLPGGRVDGPESALLGGSPLGSISPGFLPSSAAIARAEGGDPDGEPDLETGAAALPATGPETGSLVLAESQPYLLSALLRGPVSGRPDPSRAGGGRWLSADFQAMDLNLASGQSGVESDTWRAEAGIGWALSSSWSAVLSLAGIDSRMELPGFGRVDAEGAVLAWSLDCRQEGFHAALTHTLGVFDQNLRRQAGAMIHPTRQDATVQSLSLWLAREFSAGSWTHGPVASVDGSWGSLDSYREPFAGGVAMAGRDFGLATTLVGWQLAAEFDTASGGWLPHAVFGWRYRPVLADAALVQAGPRGSFALPAVSPERDSLLLEVGLRWLPPGDRLFLDAVSSAEWRDGGDSEHSLLFKLGVDF